jgi:hypothetical protein
MRDKRFVAEHRGGPLKKEQHRQLMSWACTCAQNVMFLLHEKTDERLIKALNVARAWAAGTATVGEARKAAAGAHSVARETDNPVVTAVSRALGHTVATAHMADHAPGSALYALKALKLAGKPVDVEKNRQREILPPQIRELVISSLNSKEKYFS